MPNAASGASARTRCGAVALVCGAAQLAPGFVTPSLSPSSTLSKPSARVATLHGSAGIVPKAVRATPTAVTDGTPQVAEGPASSRHLGLSLVGAGLFARAGHRYSQSLTRRRATTLGKGDLEDAVPFELRGFSLATLFLIGGVALIVFSFGDYFIFGTGGGSGIGGLTFIYAVPVLLLGAALSYAELAPVEVETKPDATGLFDAKATPTLQKILQDVTRHRYGDDAHLDSSLKALGLTGAGRYPQLKKCIVSKADDGELEFTMLFESKDVPFTTWNDPMKKVACDRFFGPGVWSDITKYSSEKRIAALKLTTGTRPETEAPAASG